ncbi:P-loop containing nucleoside triphosphate hydrolase protein [Usnea florida]
MSNMGKKTLVDPDFTLRRVFGKSNFRPYQREIITAALEGHDVFVQAATSFGKSLCFQLPAMIDHGITIVVSPLLALMNNQVAALRAAGIPVATINSSTPTAERRDILKDLCSGHPTTRLLYVTPELVLTETFRRNLETIFSQGELSRIAIDEAHCISEWGHDFRPAYYHLSHFRFAYPTVPIICLTATAPPFVRTDIIKTLGLDSTNTKTFVTSTTRRNLVYEVRFTSDESDNRFSWLLSWLQKIYARRANDPTRSQEISKESSTNIQRSEAISGIIYVPYRSECDALSARLREHNIGAAPYHAGLSNLERNECQNKWIASASGYDIIIATTAFGMGIDKQDVRFVVHWSLPKSFEGYYQEAGRAGRDGRVARCLLFYSREDRDRTGYRIARDNGNGGNGHRDNSEGAAAKAKETQLKSRTESFQALVKYCESTDRCRRVIIGEFFGEEGIEACEQGCDVCMEGQGLKERKREGLASEEWVSTQRQREDFYGDEYD